MNKLYKADLLELINMEDIRLTDLSPESKAKSLKIQQLMQCYESLIAHQVLQWTPDTDLAESIHRLCKAHTQLFENTKFSPKSKKIPLSNQNKEENKKQNSPKKGKSANGKGKKSKPLSQSQETVAEKTQKTPEKNKGTNSGKRTLTQTSDKSQKSPKKTKVSNLLKDRAGPFKPLPCLWDVSFCVRILELLYSEEVSWSSIEQRNYIRSKRDFHLYALKNIQSVLGEKLERRVVSTHAVRLTQILYQRCVCRFQDMCTFDERTTLACLELFKTSLTLLLSPTYSLKINTVLTGITHLTEKPESASIAHILDKVLSTLTYLEAEAAEEDLDLTRKKILTAAIQIACVLLETPVPGCNVLNGVILKLEDYIRSSKQAEALQLVAALLAAARRDQREAALLDQLLDKLTVELGVIDEEEESSPERESSLFPTIDARSGHAVLGHVCAHLCDRFKCAEHLLGRARDLTAALATAVHTHQQRIDKEVKELYNSIIIELCRLSAAGARAAALRCGVGGGSARVLAAALRLYACLAALARQLPPHMAPNLRFDRLLKFTGKKLSSVIDSLITYLESSQHQQNASKVLRDTKLIPRLVLEAEQFSKHVIILGSKAKMNYKQYLSLGTARDFKIKAPVLQEVLNIRDPTEELREEEEVDINDAATEILSPVVSEREESDDEPPIIIKRKRKS